MATDKATEYKINLYIEESDKTRNTIDSLERSLKSIGDTARADIKTGLTDANKSAEELAKTIRTIATSEKDTTKELDAFNKASNNTIAQLERQNIVITRSLSEQGKAQRERLANLRKEIAALGDTKADVAKRKQLEKQVADIKKDVIEASDEELNAALQQNKTLRARLKLSQQEAKALQLQAKKDRERAKDNTKSLRDRLKAQLKFIDALKTTEGRYKAIQKAASAASKVGAGIKRVAKGAAMVGGGIIGGAIAMGGAAVSQAGAIVEREREATRIRANISKDEKQALLGDMYIKTGADYSTIVDAINRVTTVLGINNKDEIAQAAAAEIRYPGAAAMFRQQTTGAVTAGDFGKYAIRQRAIQAATGASAEQITASADKIANLRQRAFTNASMTDLQAVYLTLQNAGAYDTQEELDRAFNAFVRAQASQKENVFDFAQKYFSGEGATRGVHGATNRQQALKALSNVDWLRVGTASIAADESLLSPTEAERTAQDLRQFEETRMRMMENLVKILAPVMDEIAKFFEGESGKELIKSISTFFTSTLQKLIQFIERLVNNTGTIADAVGLTSGENQEGMVEYKSYTPPIKRGGWGFSNGGIATMPSIAGERGAEMIIPLDYSRQARGAQLTQNLVQNFNMSGNETTALSLSQAVKSRDFTRAMTHNSYMSGRLGR